MPLIGIQDKRYDPNASLYYSRNPNKNPDAPRSLSYDEIDHATKK